ncbi:MAG: type sorting protein, partial [Cytophagaceae bacterium]|nr:type sorting protein [Cytophagaceae bacterium]
EMEKIDQMKNNRRSDVSWFMKVVLLMGLLLIVNSLRAQSVAGSTWNLATATPGAGYTNWGSGVISLTDTVTGNGVCQGSAVIETSGYNPTTNFSQCYRVFFGCPGNDVIGSGGNPYSDFNGDGMSFNFFRNNTTYTATNGNTCGGGLGYDNALTGGANDGKMISIEFDTYSSLGTSTVDGSYGGGAPGSGSINDEISVHKDQNSNDLGLLPGSTINAGNLEDGLEHEVCITYNATTHLLNVTIDGAPRLTNYNLATTGGGSDFATYFGAGSTLNYGWSAGKYGANNMQTIGPSGQSIFGTIGHNLCTNTAPVTLISFTGKTSDGTAVLNWATAMEVDNKEFIIEHSADGSNWEAIGHVAGAGNSQAVLHYTYTDYFLVTGISYYRLKQVDFNGDFHYSKIIAVAKSMGQHISLVPNPFDDAITISVDLIGKIHIQIVDVLGKLVYQTTKEGSEGIPTIYPELQAGTYIITVQTDTFVEQQKIIKK